MLANRVIASAAKANVAYAFIAYSRDDKCDVVYFASKDFKKIEQATVVPGCTIFTGGIAYGNGALVVPAWEYIYTSLDGGRTWSTWNSGNDISGINDYFDDVVFANGRFVAMGRKKGICTSTDGITWTRRTVTLQQGHALSSATYIDGYFYLTGNNVVLRASDAAYWWYEKHYPAQYFTNGEATRIVKGSTKYAFALSCCVFTSSDNGNTWTQIQPYNTDVLNDIIYANGKFIAVGKNGAICTSTSGSSWAGQTIKKGSAYTLDFSSIAYGNDIFVAVGGSVTTGHTSYGDIYTSTDGNTWTERYSPKGVEYRMVKVIYDGTQFIALCASSRILTSTNGIIWNEAVYSTNMFSLKNIIKLN